MGINVTLEPFVIFSMEHNHFPHSSLSAPRNSKLVLRQQALYYLKMHGVNFINTSKLTSCQRLILNLPPSSLLATSNLGSIYSFDMIHGRTFTPLLSFSKRQTALVSIRKQAFPDGPIQHLHC